MIDRDWRLTAIAITGAVGSTPEDRRKRTLEGMARRKGERLTELEALNSRLAALALEEAHGWQLRAGPLRIRGRVSSGTVALITIIFLSVTLISGVVLMIYGAANELGIALVVGSIFGLSSCLTQFWAVANAREAAVYGEIFTRPMIEDARRQLATSLDAIHQEVAQLDHEIKLATQDGAKTKSVAIS
jgi:hypothetical protein